MFRLRRPSARELEAFRARLADLPLSYGEPGIAESSPPGYNVDEIVAPIGRGEQSFELAKTSLATWVHFRLGWLELVPPSAPIEPGANVAVLIHHFGFWSLNGCRVLCVVGRLDGDDRYGFTYGTLTDHAETGEEIFEVSRQPATGLVLYRIRAVSRPRALLARVGYPVARALQRRFRRDSVSALRHAIRAGS